jgi:hypothetical protein
MFTVVPNKNHVTPTATGGEGMGEQAFEFGNCVYRRKPAGKHEITVGKVRK